MIPLKDRNRSRSFPFVTIGIIIVNALVFLVELDVMLRQGNPGLQEFIRRYGIVPAALFDPLRYGENGTYLALRSLITTQFVHGGVAHIVMNMLFLWVFGDNVEDVLGHARFLAFYLTCGVAGGLLHALTSPTSTVPAVGASGAISGVMAAYLVLFPRSRIVTAVFFFFITLVEIPAVLLIGYWFVLQVISGLASLGTAARGGTAWFAHIGGFAAGYFMLRLTARRARPRAPRGPRIWVED